MDPRKVKMLGGREIELDGDLIPILEGLYEEVAVSSGFEHDYLDMRREIEHLVAQLEIGELREYFMNSLFLNFVSYENEMASRILESIARTKAGRKGLGSSRSRKPAKPSARSRARR